MNNVVGNNLLRFLILLPVQVLILNYVHLFGFINPYVYLMALLLLPVSMSKSLQYLIAFATGMIVDIFSMTYGVHASASLFVIFFRPFILEMMNGNRANDNVNNSLQPGAKSLSWIVGYTALMVFIHHFLVTMLEVFTFHNFWRNLGSTIVNTMFTTFCIICLEYIFIPSKNQNN